MSETENNDKLGIAKVTTDVFSGITDIKKHLLDMKLKMIDDLVSYDVRISTVETQAEEVKNDQSIDDLTKTMLLQGLREYWAIKRKKMLTETKGSTRK